MFFICISINLSANKKIMYWDFSPNTKENATIDLQKVINECINNGIQELHLKSGRYDFYPDSSLKKKLYISAHDHQVDRAIGVDLSGLNNFTINGNGSELVFHENMLPICLYGCSQVTLKNFSIDFEKPYFTQAFVVEVTPNYVDLSFEPDVQYMVKDKRLYINSCLGKIQMQIFMAYDKDSRSILPKTGDALGGYLYAEEISHNVVRLYSNTMSNFLKRGNILFMRNGYRPNPGIFAWNSKNLCFENINIYWAQGMGILSQRCENITMRKVNVCPKPNSKRVFSTIDALHFTACRGLISISDGLYENMQDDALNVHGDYLQIQKIDRQNNSLIVQYKHCQSFGYEVALDGEIIQFVNAETMLPVGKMKVCKVNKLDSIRTQLFFGQSLPINIKEKDCIENLDCTPELIYSNNIIRNNRARGILISSPRKAIIKNNCFDNCSGSAILLSADCNSWFLSGACHDVTISGNVFKNCLTSSYQYCEGIISIFPEMYKLVDSTYYNSNINIKNNKFFQVNDVRLLYAKSVDNISFINNKIDSVGLNKDSLVELIHCRNINLK